MNFIRKTILLLMSAFILCPTGGAKERPQKPNVVLLLADDLGWQDVNCYDLDAPTPMETPHIDALAKKGVLFRQGYSPAPTCAPTRCAIMSGRHPAVAQKTHVVGGNPPTPYNKLAHPIMDPWYSGRMKLEEVTIAEALRTNGYVSGHTGKWHMAIDHNAFPQPEDQGFAFTRHDLGESRAMRPHRLTGFATRDKEDPFQLDADGFPKDQTTVDAIQFMQENKAYPFFLYYAAWLVHTPIHSRSKKLLEKYCKKLDVPYPTDPKGWLLEGQRNPYYCAMVEMFDHYVGQIIQYLEQTDDPRWPGHKLVENTYVIFTSDNGGMEKVPGEIITDNYPLDKGKINAKEGGVRVPFIIVGPQIKPNQESNVMVNGLDFYPTILSWTGTKKPKKQNLDGSDLSDLLRQNPKAANLVKDKNEKTRNAMVWHFPHGVAQQSTLRVDGWKLIFNYMPKRPQLELYQLYENYPNPSKRTDIEEAKNLADKMPEKAEQMRKELFRRLNAMQASYPYRNPHFKHPLPHKDNVCQALENGREGAKVWARFKERGSKVVSGQIVYTVNGGHKSEEWYLTDAKVKGDRLIGILPKDTTHYVFNLVDEHNFLVSYPDMPDMMSGGNGRGKAKYSAKALKK
ncbi:MAG: sulfatase [Opitutae bacterium]|nr:sulfatase [Opitutae bacterium]